MDQFERIKLQIKEENYNKIKDLNILIIGLGGVGSYAVESLIRMGIENITIVDSDIIDITNLNRQLMTNHNNIGEYKADVIEKRIKSINPNCNITKINKFITKDNIEQLFKNKLDYIVDACDTIETKKYLIKCSIKHNIKIISCMGTGNKLDPSKLEIADIRKTSYDPIAKILRKMVIDEKIKAKIPVIYSKEVPIKTNSKTISSNSFVPATAGLLMTSYIINDVVDKEIIYG